MSDVFELGEGPVRNAPTTTPRYRIVPSTDRVSVKRGETAKFSIYFTGYGEFERHKFTMFSEFDDLLSSDGGTIAIPFSKDEEGGISYGEPALEADDYFKHSIEGNSVTMYISELLFFDSPNSDIPEDNASDRLYPTIITEGDWGEHAPVEIELSIAEDVKPGDYNIQMYFLYSDRLETYHAEADIKIHVQTKVEEYEPWPQRAAIFAGIIALVSLLYQTGVFSYISSLL